MFTGIITSTGKLNKKRDSVFIFNTDRAFCRKLRPGASIAVNGICLTILAKPSENSFSVEVMPETKKRTMLKKLKSNGLVNLELPATLNSLLSGHLVSGHIDGTAKLKKIIPKKNSRVLKFSIARSLSKYIVKKGSITINGISLTVIDINKNYFTVGIIPYTREKTMLKIIRVNDIVNIEIDLVAKYLEKLLNYEKKR